VQAQRIQFAGATRCVSATGPIAAKVAPYKCGAVDCALRMPRIRCGSPLRRFRARCHRNDPTKIPESS